MSCCLDQRWPAPADRPTSQHVVEVSTLLKSAAWPIGLPRFRPTAACSTNRQALFKHPSKLPTGRQKPSGNFSTSTKRTHMNKDQVKGAAEQGKGKVKEAAGDLTGNKSLEREGEADQVKGKVQKNHGDAKENVKDGIDKL
jgi:uncharacterized protein YjbJ (UPF0337 family)